MQKWLNKNFIFLETPNSDTLLGTDYFRDCLNSHKQGSWNSIMDAHEKKLEDGFEISF